MAEQQSFLSSWQERLTALRNTPPVLKIVWQSGPGVVVFGLVARLFASLLPLALLWIPKLIVDEIVHPKFAAHVMSPRLWWLVAGEFGLAVLGGILARAIDYSDSLLADKYTRHVSIQVMKHAAELDLIAYEDPVFYDRLERARVQATDRLGMIQQIGRLIQLVITTTTLSVTIIVYSPWLMLMLIAGVLPAFLGESHFAFLGYAKNFRQTPVRRQLDYLRQVGGSKEAAKELKLFGLSQFLTQRFTRLSDGIYQENVALSRRKLIAGAFLSVIAFMGYYSAYVFVIWRTVTGAFSIGLWYLLSGAILQASSNIQQIFSTVSGIADQALFLTDLLAFFDMRPTIQSKPDALPAPRPIVRGFEFRNVSFRYPGSSRLVLNGLNFHLHPGERVALIGENGEGKTTIVKLITRLYDPTEGQVLLDGVDLREYRLEDLYREIGVIFQDFMRYEMTARENIAVGRIEEIDDLKLVEDAARKSLADAVIAKLSGGYDQMLGRRFETGVDLSGGEWQKVALARAYLRDAQLLILDEPTAALDARSEFEVFQRFAELTAGKMALFISHRFSTVRMADRIVVLENGKIAEEGSHEQLARLGGRYKEMFELQAASYR
ncbi:MAG: ABC transporter ATP-binding protein/permease [Acidobacteriia bacterium]|jgi:ATP-binding cassette subfamily B protein|nr:ABC transporter ATP-binding protein/permease [Terriglobia bacterium]